MPSTRILVVESEAEVRDVIAGFLQRKGHVVQAVADGAAARAVLVGPPPDAVVVRITLADGTAPALVRMLAELEPPRPGLVLTGSKGSADDFVRRVDCGGARVLLKPFGGAELLRAVEEALAQPAFPTRAPAPVQPSPRSGSRDADELNADFGSLLGDATPAPSASSGQRMRPGFPATTDWPEPPPPPPPPLQVRETGAVALLSPQVPPPPPLAFSSPPPPAFAPVPPAFGPGAALAFDEDAPPPDESVEGDWAQLARDGLFAAPTGASRDDPWADDPLASAPPPEAEGEGPASQGGGLDDAFDLGFDEVDAAAPALPAWTPGGHSETDAVEGLPGRQVDDERGLRLQPMVGEEGHDPRGIYGEVRLAEVLVRCHRDRFTGRLVLLRGPVRKVVSLVDGRPVGGTSNLRGESLRAVIAERGLVDMNFLAAQAVPDQALPDALVAAGVLSPTQANGLRQARIIGALLEAFGWTGGQYGLVYDPAEVDRASGPPVEVAPLVLRGLTEITPFAPIAQFFDGRARESVRTTLRFADEQASLALPGDQALFVQTFDGRRTVSELLALSPTGIVGTLRLLRALAELDCVVFGPAGASGFEDVGGRLITGQPASMAAVSVSPRFSTGIPLERLDDMDEDWLEAGFRALGPSRGPSSMPAEARHESPSGMPGQVGASVPPAGMGAGEGRPARAGIYRSGPARASGPTGATPSAAASPVRPPSVGAGRRPESVAARPRGESVSPSPTGRGVTDGPVAGRATASPLGQRPGLMRPGTAAPRGQGEAATGGPASMSGTGGPSAAGRPTVAPAVTVAAPRQSAAAAAPAASPARLKALLEAKHAALNTVDHYTLLEVGHEATAEEIGASYRKLSRDIHQAATHEPKLFDKATEVGRALADAAQTLSDRRKRAQYDAITLGNLAGPALETDVPGAAAAFARGKACLDRRDVPEAYEHFDRATRLDSGPTLYRMYAAFARFRLSFPKHRKASVEAHDALKSALLDDATQDEGFLLMAQIYRDTGNNELAARFYRKALSLNRNNRHAQEGLVALGHGDELQGSGVFGRIFGRKA